MYESCVCIFELEALRDLQESRVSELGLGEWDVGVMAAVEGVGRRRLRCVWVAR